MSIEDLQRAFASSTAVLAGVSPDQYDLPTPCKSWNVRQLIEHMIGVPHASVRALTTGNVEIGEEKIEGDYLAAYEAATADVLTALNAPGALDTVVTLPFGEFPATFLLVMMTTDQFTHAWDLAKATGQSTDLDPEFAEKVMAAAQIPDDYRGEDGKASFGPKLDAPKGAHPADRLAAHLGRAV